MATSHGTGEPGPCGAVPPRPVETPPAGGWPLPDASSRLTTSRPLALSSTTRVWTVPAASVTFEFASAPTAFTVTVDVPGETTRYLLTVANFRSLASVAEAKLTLTTCCFSDAWITRTSARPDGVVR